MPPTKPLLVIRKSDVLRVMRDHALISTTIGGMLVVFISECPTCDAEPGHRCRAATHPDRHVSDQVHSARRKRAIRLILDGPL